MTLSRFSIQRKQTLVIILTSCASLLLSTIGFVAFDILSFRGATTERLMTLAEVLGENCALPLKSNDLKVANKVLSDLRAEPHVIGGCLYSYDGRLLAKYQNRQTGRNFAPPAIKPDGHYFSLHRLVLFHSIKYQNNKVGTIYLESDLLELSARLQQYAFILIAILLITLLAAFLLSSRLHRVIYGPILQLAQASRAVAQQKNYSVRVPKETQDELGQLIDDFNEMLVQIQILDKALQNASVKLEERVVERTRDLELEVWERKHAEKMLRQQFSRLSLLNQIARAVAARQDLPSIFSVMLRDLQEHLPVDFAAVYLLDPNKTHLAIASYVPNSEPQEAVTEVIETFEVNTECADSMKRGEMLSFESAAEKGCLLALQRIKSGLPSGWIIPLSIQNQPFGILVAGRKNPQGFNSDEGKFLLMVCEHVTLAAHQGQLYVQLQTAYEELRATQQAVLKQERLRALGQMASGIAHDINNALVPIMGFTDLMLAAPNLPPGDTKKLTSIKNASLDIVRTVERMREFYRHREENEMLSSIDLNKLVQAAIDLSRPRWRDIPQERGVVMDVRQEPDPCLPPVRGIESEIRQALINLILNSVDAMPKGGNLIARTRQVEKTTLSNQTNRWVAVEITDTGVGMDQEKRRRCFEPFFSTKAGRGTGLGLAMVYGVMERHEGHIEIDSTPNEGTTVHLFFPMQNEKPAMLQPLTKARPLNPQVGLRILCIDDETSILDVLKTILKRLGHQVTVCDDGQSGVEALQKAIVDQQPFDVVITDLGMPGMDGRAVALAVKRESPATKVILLTGWGMFMESGEQLPGIDHVMSKPCTMKDLQAALILVGTQKAVL